jgi:hypothetical protein
VLEFETLFNTVKDIKTFQYRMAIKTIPNRDFETEIIEKPDQSKDVKTSVNLGMSFFGHGILSEGGSRYINLFIYYNGLDKGFFTDRLYGRLNRPHQKKVLCKQSGMGQSIHI